MDGCSSSVVPSSSQSIPFPSRPIYLSPLPKVRTIPKPAPALSHLADMAVMRVVATLARTLRWMESMSARRAMDQAAVAAKRTTVRYLDSALRRSQESIHQSKGALHIPYREEM